MYLQLGCPVGAHVERHAREADGGGGYLVRVKGQAQDRGLGATLGWVRANIRVRARATLGPLGSGSVVRVRVGWPRRRPC